MSIAIYEDGTGKVTRVDQTARTSAAFAAGATVYVLPSKVGLFRAAGLDARPDTMLDLAVLDTNPPWKLLINPGGVVSVDPAGTPPVTAPPAFISVERVDLLGLESSATVDALLVKLGLP